MFVVVKSSEFMNDVMFVIMVIIVVECYIGILFIFL